MIDELRERSKGQDCTIQEIDKPLWIKRLQSVGPVSKSLAHGLRRTLREHFEMCNR
jgi:hypothetical protein